MDRLAGKIRFLVRVVGNIEQLDLRRQQVAPPFSAPTERGLCSASSSAVSYQECRSVGDYKYFFDLHDEGNAPGNSQADSREFTTVLATGLWPVDLEAPFHTKEDGPQGRGYSGYSFDFARSPKLLGERV